FTPQVFRCRSPEGCRETLPRFALSVATPLRDRATRPNCPLRTSRSVRLSRLDMHRLPSHPYAVGMTNALVGGPELEQVRRIVTDIPGPRSLDLANRRKAALPAGLTSSAGIYVAAAGGGVVVDVDGNSFIDLGSGIAVTTVGNAAPAVVSRAADQLARYTHA